MDPDAAVVFDEAELAEAVHEEADAGAGGADHLGQGLLGDLGDQGLRFAGLAELGHQQQDAGQALFAGVEELIDKIGLGAHAAGQQERQEEIGEGMLLVHDADHLVASILSAVQAVMAVAVAMRSPGTAASDSSPTKSPGERSVMVASLPSGFRPQHTESAPA